MCGFAGVVTWDEKYRVTRDTLQKMSRAIAHRGPDGEGFHLTREQEPITPQSPQVGLAFRRLAILDPDPRSDQPFHLGPLTLVFNGEIYNFRELRKELSQLRPDHEWRTTGDTEVLLLAYEVWREKCVEKLNGMFAFAVWDEQKRELFLARDRMGQKPLYYALEAQYLNWERLRDGYQYGLPRRIVFASELSALQNCAGLALRVGNNLSKYLAVGYFPGEETIYESVLKLKPGHTALVNFEDIAIKTYFSETTGTDRVGNPVNCTRELVLRAVQKQLVSDVPIACFLSGGIDSSIIALGMQSAPGRTHNSMTFSIGFGDRRYDELEYAEAVARHLGTKHESFVVKPSLVQELPRLAAAFGEPFADSSALPTHYLSQKVREFVKVALSGDGGDELFGGYDRYRAIYYSRNFASLPAFLPSGVKAVLKLAGGAHQKSWRTRARRFLAGLQIPLQLRYPSVVQLFSPQEIFELRCREREADLEYLFRIDYAKLLIGRDPVTAALALDRSNYLPGDLLTKVDRCSMMHGLEVRSPFMDHELVQFAAGLTTDQLLKGGPKRMLREAFAKDLPDFVFKRKKMGFAVPIGEWFRGELRSMLRENLFASNSFGRSHFDMKVVERLVDEHESQRVDHSQRLYALLMLELWWQQQRPAQ